MTKIPPPFPGGVVPTDRVAFWNGLRELGPVLVDTVGAEPRYCLTGRDEVISALRNPAVFSSKSQTPRLNAFGSEWEHSLVTCDPPEHTRLRRILNPFFTPLALGEMLPILRAQAAALIGAAAAKGRCEAMSEIAVRFPFQALLVLFGLPLHHRDGLIAKCVGIPNPDGADGLELLEYLTGAVYEASDDELSAGILPRLVTGDEALTEDEAIVFAGVLFTVQHTTIACIGFALLELARNPALRSALREDPEQIAAFVEEIVRIESPSSCHRVTTEEVTVAGVTLPAASAVDLYLGPLNIELGDEICMTDDGKVRRQAHWAWGGGIHRCIGTALARTELTMIVAEWLRRIPVFELAPGFVPDVIYRHVFTLASLPLRWG